MMPRISGFEVCKRLRADPATRDIAVLMVTALDQPSDIDRAVEAGTDDFLTKPINKTELLLPRPRPAREPAAQARLDRTLAYIEAVEQRACREHEPSNPPRVSCQPASAPGRSTAGTPGSSPGPSPPSRATRPTATRSISSRTPATSSPAACTTAGARSASASTRWDPDGRSTDDFFRDRLAAAVRLRRDVLGLDGPGRAAGSCSARATACPA